MNLVTWELWPIPLHFRLKMLIVHGVSEALLGSCVVGEGMGEQIATRQSTAPEGYAYTTR